MCLTHEIWGRIRNLHEGVSGEFCDNSGKPRLGNSALSFQGNLSFSSFLPVAWKEVRWEEYLEGTPEDSS